MNAAPGQVVRRSDLADNANGLSAASDEDEAVEATYMERLKQAYDEEYTDAEAVPSFANAGSNQATVSDEDEARASIAADEYDFPLLAGSTAVNADRKITLRSPSPDNAEKLLRVGRPLSYYLASPPSDILANQFRAAAVSGADLHRQSLVPWQGAYRPWRVTIVKQNGGLLPKDDAPAAKRRRPGKKRRIILRKRQVLKDEQAARAAETDREKRNRRNREKKVKRREKKRESKKQAAVQEEEGANG